MNYALRPRKRFGVCGPLRLHYGVLCKAQSRYVASAYHHSWCVIWLAFSEYSRFSLWLNERIVILVTYEETIELLVGEHEK